MGKWSDTNVDFPHRQIILIIWRVQSWSIATDWHILGTNRRIRYVENIHKLWIVNFNEWWYLITIKSKGHIYRHILKVGHSDMLKGDKDVPWEREHRKNKNPPQEDVKCLDVPDLTNNRTNSGEMGRYWMVNKAKRMLEKGVQPFIME